MSELLSRRVGPLLFRSLLASFPVQETNLVDNLNLLYARRSPSFSTVCYLRAFGAICRILQAVFDITLPFC